MIDKLEMLIALERERHFGRAAETCHVTQPTLSSAIKALEEQLGSQLVLRGARFMGFTAEGERVLARAKTIVAEARAMRSDVQVARQGLTGTLRLGVIPTALAAVDEFTRPFLAKHPGVRLRILSMTSRDILERLADFDIDAGLSYAVSDRLPKGASEAEVVPLYSESYALVTPTAPGLPDTLTWSQLDRFELGLLTPDMQNRRILDTHLEQAGIHISPRIESSSIVALIGHLQAPGTATILPLRAATFFAEGRDLTCIPIAMQETSASDVAFVLPPVGRRTLLLDAFVQSLSQ